jgi:hypothetical protein
VVVLSICGCGNIIALTFERKKGQICGFLKQRHEVEADICKSKFGNKEKA